MMVPDSLFLNTSIPPGALRLWGVVRAHQNEGGLRMSINDIAATFKITSTTANTWRKALIDTGWIAAPRYGVLYASLGEDLPDSTTRPATLEINLPTCTTNAAVIAFNVAHATKERAKTEGTPRPLTEHQKRIAVIHAHSGIETPDARQYSMFAKISRIASGEETFFKNGSEHMIPGLSPVATLSEIEEFYGWWLWKHQGKLTAPLSPVKWREWFTEFRGDDTWTKEKARTNPTVDTGEIADPIFEMLSTR